MQASQVCPEIQYKTGQELVEEQYKQEFEFVDLPSQKVTDDRAKDKIDNAKQNFQRKDIGKVPVEQDVVTGNFPACEVFNPKIKQDLKNQGKIQKDKVAAIIVGTHCILYTDIDTKGINRFDEQIQE
jgi:hypothetical protein